MGRRITGFDLDSVVAFHPNGEPLVDGNDDEAWAHALRTAELGLNPIDLIGRRHWVLISNRPETNRQLVQQFCRKNHLNPQTIVLTGFTGGLCENKLRAIKEYHVGIFYENSPEIVTYLRQQHITTYKVSLSKSDGIMHIILEGERDDSLV